MKVRLAGATAIAITIAVAPANAAGFGYRSPDYSNPTYAPMSMQRYSWMGPYIGGNLGYEWANTTNNPTDPNGFTGGIQGGYNWQSGQFVFGGETDLQLSEASDRFAAWKFSNPWFGTLRGRAGIAMNNILIYGTGGLAYGDVKAETAALSEIRTHFGWAAGIGLEVGFTPHWSARAEYLYIDLNERGYPATTGTQNGLESNLLRLGVNYHF